jgi:hypothetical protein
MFIITNFKILIQCGITYSENATINAIDISVICIFNTKMFHGITMTIKTVVRTIPQALQLNAVTAPSRRIRQPPSTSFVIHNPLTSYQSTLCGQS